MITRAEPLFMDVLSNETCTGIINDKTMPHNISIKYKIQIQCIGARAYTNTSIGEDLFWAIRSGGGNSFGVVIAWNLNGSGS